MTSEAKKVAWSDQQTAIFNWFATGRNHLIVRARAGTGKTTTIIEGISYAKENSILLCAFNKRIADELCIRLTNPKAMAKTLHAVGYAAVRRFWEGLRIANGSERADALANEVCGPRCPDAIKRLVSKLHTKAREIAPHATTPDEIYDIAVNFECEPDEEQWLGTGFDTNYVIEMALRAMELAATVKPLATGIDFSDMIFLPVRNGWLTKSYDLVVVDEAQDMTVAQLEIARGVCRGRICVVGDDRQAIYGFRGADSDSLNRLKRELKAEELGLTTTYRCGKSIVAEAAKLVPDFQAGPNNPDGRIYTLPMEKLMETVALSDFVLSRTNAPLVNVAMALLRTGKRAQIAGRDIGAGLKSLIRKLAKGPAATSVPALIVRIRAWETKEADRLIKANKEAKADNIHDQAETLLSLAESAKSVNDLTAKIDALFTDDGLGQAGMVTCSSVHRAKGLEANRVFVLADTLKAHTDEELNIQYVAFTRAKAELVLVFVPKV